MPTDGTLITQILMMAAVLRKPNGKWRASAVRECPPWHLPAYSFTKNLLDDFPAVSIRTRYRPGLSAPTSMALSALFTSCFSTNAPWLSKMDIVLRATELGSSIWSRASAGFWIQTQAKVVASKGSDLRDQTLTGRPQDP